VFLKMNKLILSLIFVLFFMSFISAEVQTLKPVEQTECINIPQSHPNATSINVTRVRYPNGFEDYTVRPMSSENGYNYNYTFCNTTALGGYEITTCGNGDGYIDCPVFDFEVTPSGQSGTSNIVFSIFLILVLLGLNLFAFFGKNEILTVLSGMALIFLGVYLINNGVIIYRDDLTNYLAYIIGAWGFITGLWATFSLTDIL